MQRDLPPPRRSLLVRPPCPPRVGRSLVLVAGGRCAVEYSPASHLQGHLRVQVPVQRQLHHPPGLLQRAQHPLRLEEAHRPPWRLVRAGRWHGRVVEHQHHFHPLLLPRPGQLAAESLQRFGGHEARHCVGVDVSVNHHRSPPGADVVRDGEEAGRLVGPHPPFLGPEHLVEGVHVLMVARGVDDWHAPPQSAHLVPHARVGLRGVVVGEVPRQHYRGGPGLRFVCCAEDLLQGGEGRNPVVDICAVGVDVVVSKV
mmetsp:Transcript_41232/g.131932  ORF Transcript_41232/g.131932 Transcript_41232/m.131932 type:complete len:256 (+) Transcript_41232:251-1018(+)